MKEAPGSSETSVLTEPHGVTTQKTPFFIVTAVKTSNLIFRGITLIPNASQSLRHPTNIDEQSNC
jgi:hypothetical protein